MVKEKRFTKLGHQIYWKIIIGRGEISQEEYFELQDEMKREEYVGLFWEWEEMDINFDVKG